MIEMRMDSFGTGDALDAGVKRIDAGQFHLFRDLHLDVFAKLLFLPRLAHVHKSGDVLGLQFFQCPGLTADLDRDGGRVGTSVMKPVRLPNP